MMRTKLAFLGLIPALAFAACSGENGVDHAAVEQEQPIVSEPTLIGTFSGAKSIVGELAQLVLKTDATFHAATFVACADIKAPCDPVQQDGTYRLLLRGKLKIVNLYSVDGTLLNQYQYEVQGDTVRMRRLSSAGSWQSMQRSNVTWCAEASDCALQNIPPGPCAGNWTCEKNACSFWCGPIAAEPPSRTGG